MIRFYGCNNVETKRDTMKKVLVITNLPTPYKIDFYNRLCKYCDLTVVVEAKRIKSQRFNWNDDTLRFKLICLNDGFLDERKINFSILRSIKRSYDEIIIAAYYMPTELIALLYLKLMRIPYWFETDGGMINHGEGMLQRMFKCFFIKGAKGYISPSMGTDEYLTYYKANANSIYRYPFTSLLKADMLSAPIEMKDKVEIRKRLGIPCNNKMVLSVGQFIHRKGFDILLKSAAMINRNYSFCIVGGSDRFILKP